MVVANTRVSTTSARAHTKRNNQGSSFSIPKGIFTKVSLILLAGLLALAEHAIHPPKPTICGSPNGPPITSSRIKLKDGRHLSYIETGVPKDKAKYKIIFIHGLDNCKYDKISISKEVEDEFGISLVSFDRAGYGESDPNPNASEKSIALDIEELADQLKLGSKFYVIGFSMGGAYAWSCLNYIPHRLAGAALLAPAANFWWPSFPANVTNDAFHKLRLEDQWAYRVAHYAPWLTYWWNIQKWFPSAASILVGRPDIFSTQDIEIIKSNPSARDSYKALPSSTKQEAQPRQQGEFESVHRDLMIGLGSWEFDPINLENPFPNGEGTVHLWHGAEDLIVPVSLSRYISHKLPWVAYHELPDAGHLFPLVDVVGDSIVKALVSGH